MTELNEELENLYKLQRAAKELVHGIKDGDWRPFEPTIFVYAFFAFNSFYSIDWIRTVEQRKVTRWNYMGSEVGNSGQKMYESEKIIEIIHFIQHAFERDNDLDLEVTTNRLDFSTVVQKNLKMFLVDDVESSRHILSYITVDSNVTNSRKEKFINNYMEILQNKPEGEELVKALEGVLIFIFRVRNNIFHGTKTMLDMMETGQQKRLRIYASILLAVNETLFEAVEKQLGWDKEQIDKRIEEDRRHKNARRGSRNARVDK